MPDDKKFDDNKFFEDLENDLEDDDNKKDDSDADDKSDDKDKKDDGPTQEERLAALEKENKGLKKAVVDNRQGKSQFKTELDELKGIIKEGLSQRGSETDDNKDGDNTDDKSEIERLPLEFDEDGKGYVVVKDLQESLKETIQQSDKKVDDVEKKLTETEQIKQAIEARENHIQSIIDEKPGRDVAYKTLTKGLTTLDNKLRELVQASDLPKNVKERGLLPGPAIKMLTTTDGALDDFNKLNLGVDLEVVARMMESDWDLEKALDSYVSLQQKDVKDEDSDIVDNLKKKPAGPGSAANQKDTGTSIVDKVSGFKTEDILEMDDDTVVKLMKRMEREADE